MKQVNIFIVHYTKLVARENVVNRVKAIFSRMVMENQIKLFVSVVSKFDPENLDTSFVQRIFDKEPIKDPAMQAYNQFIPLVPQKNMMSNALKHMDALNQIYKKSEDDDINIILEDDVVFDANVEPNIREFIESMMYMNPEKPGTPYDMVFFGLPGPRPSGTNSLSVDHVKELGLLPCCDSYFVSKECAKILTKDYVPIKFPNNIQISYIVQSRGLCVAKTYPNLFADGSKMGSTPSSISSNNALIFSQLYKTVYTFLQKPEGFQEEEDTIMNLLDENELKNTADFVFLRGLVHKKLGHYTEAKTFFDTAIVLYQENMSPLNNNSSIINNYIDLCKHVQKTYS